MSITERLTGPTPAHQQAVASLPSKLREDTPEHVILRDLMNEALTHPERCDEIIGIFFQQMNGLIDTCSKSKDGDLAKTLKVAAQCLSTIHDAFADGDVAQKALIQKHEEQIGSVTQTALECITSIPKKKRARPSSPPPHTPEADKSLPPPPEKKMAVPPPKEMPAAHEPSSEQLVAAALQRHDDDALLSCIEAGASMKLFSSGDKDRLAAYAATTLNDAALAALIRGGCQIYNPEGQSPILLDAVSSSLVLSVRALIERHANLHTTDAQGNTALHRAFLLGNPEMVRLLTKLVDPQAMNRFRQTPLQAILDVRPENIDYLQLPESRLPSFFESLFTRKPEELPGGAVFKTPARETVFKICGGKIPPIPFDIVEMAFLANNPDLNAALFHEMDTNTFLAACARLENLYPQESVNLFMVSPYAINPYHFQMGGASAPVRPLGAKNPRLETFLKLFDNLNFANPTAPHYVDATAWWKECTSGREVLPCHEAIAHIRQDLENGLGRIIRKERYAAVPSFQPEKWFARMELLLKNVILCLEEKKNPATTLNTLKELRGCFQHCATALTTTAINLYERLCFNIDPSQPHLAFLRPLANHRRQCFDDAVNMVLDGEIHHGHHALVVLGPELGLIGHEEAAAYVDPGFQGDIQPEAIKKDFFARYTSSSIIEWLTQALRTNTDNIRDPYIDLHRHFMNPQWNHQRYAPILEQLAVLEKGKNTATIDALLEKSEIVKISKDQPPREAIEQDRFSDYLAHFVFDDMGKFRPQAAVHLLSCMGVIQSSMK